MATIRQQAALNAAHKPGARRRAAATMQKQIAARAKLSRIYGEPARAFMKKTLADTVSRHEIPWNAVPAVLLGMFGKKQREKMLGNGKANGHDRGGPGVGIPLDAIPERKPKAAGNGAAYTPRGKAHPNAELIGKVIDLLGHPDTDKNRSKVLLTALDKLLA